MIANPHPQLGEEIHKDRSILSKDAGRAGTKEPVKAKRNTTAGSEDEALSLV